MDLYLLVKGIGPITQKADTREVGKLKYYQLQPLSELEVSTIKINDAESQNDFLPEPKSANTPDSCVSQKTCPSQEAVTSKHQVGLAIDFSWLIGEAIFVKLLVSYYIAFRCPVGIMGYVLG